MVDAAAAHSVCLFSRQLLRPSSDGGPQAILSAPNNPLSMGADSALSLHSMRNFDPATVLQHNRRAQTSLSGGGGRQVFVTDSS